MISAMECHGVNSVVMHMYVWMCVGNYHLQQRYWHFARIPQFLSSHSYTVLFVLHTVIDCYEKRNIIYQKGCPQTIRAYNGEQINYKSVSPLWPCGRNQYSRCFIMSVIGCIWRCGFIVTCMHSFHVWFSSAGFYGRPWSMDQRKVLFQW